MKTKLNITNYNPNLNDDQKYIEQFIKFMELIKIKLSTKKYKSYQSFISKLNKYVSIISQQLQKEISQNNEDDDYFDENNLDEIENDNISVASISEYELDEDTNDFEEIKIKDFEDTMMINYFEYLNRFDFDFVRKCVY